MVHRPPQPFYILTSPTFSIERHLWISPTQMRVIAMVYASILSNQASRGC